MCLFQLKHHSVAFTDIEFEDFDTTNALLHKKERLQFASRIKQLAENIWYPFVIEKYSLFFMQKIAVLLRFYSWWDQKLKQYTFQLSHQLLLVYKIILEQKIEVQGFFGLFKIES